LQLPGGTDLLEAALKKTGARLVLFDPVMAFLDQSVTANSDQGVRRALSPLAHLADRTGAAALMVRHLNKKGGGRALYRGGGSIGLLAACRSGWLIGRDPLRPDYRVLAPIKNNLAGLQSSLGYELRAQPSGPPTLGWLGPCPWSADQVLIATESRCSPRLERACRFLADFLHHAPAEAHVIWRAAQKEGVSVGTLKRAKKRLRIQSSRPYEGGVQRTYWRLPNQALPAAPASSAIDPELARYFTEKEQQFPPACPLDEE
jgi:hypothetical protein